CSGLISSHTFSSLLHSANRPGCSLASLMTSVNGFCCPAAAAAAAAAAATTVGALGAARAVGDPGAEAPPWVALSATSAAAVAAAVAAATVAESCVATVAHP